MARTPPLSFDAGVGVSVGRAPSSPSTPPVGMDAPTTTTPLAIMHLLDPGDGPQSPAHDHFAGGQGRGPAAALMPRARASMKSPGNASVESDDALFATSPGSLTVDTPPLGPSRPGWAATSGRDPRETDEPTGTSAASRERAGSAASLEEVVKHVRLVTLPPVLRHIAEVPLFNFAQVEPGVYRSGFPTPETTPFLLRIGLKSVVNLYDAPEFPDYPQVLEKAGIKHFWFHVVGNKKTCRDMDMGKITQALRHVMDRRNHPLLIHCRSGKHRTGCLVGVLRRVQHWPMDVALHEYSVYSSPKERQVDLEYIRIFPMEAVVKAAEEYSGLEEARCDWLGPARHSDDSPRSRDGALSCSCVPVTKEQVSAAALVGGVLVEGDDTLRSPDPTAFVESAGARASGEGDAGDGGAAAGAGADAGDGAGNHVGASPSASASVGASVGATAPATAGADCGGGGVAAPQGADDLGSGERSA